MNKKLNDSVHDLCHNFCELVPTLQSIISNEVLLHRPVFDQAEEDLVVKAVRSNFVSSVGAMVDEFETITKSTTGSKHAASVVNGTAALHLALKAVGVEKNSEVLTQALTFVATSNAITYCGARPIFIDVDEDTLGMSPTSLRTWLKANADIDGGRCINRGTGAEISACLPMHTFGNVCRIDELAEICEEFLIPLVEDSAEALGSTLRDRHVGTYGLVGTFSYNGNKIITTGGGGMVITDSEEVASRVKHLSTTAKLPHQYEYFHDEAGYNYRMPNLNAALGIAQMQKLPGHLKVKKQIYEKYLSFFKLYGLRLIEPLENSCSNHWLNAVVFETYEQRTEFIELTNQHGIMTRPVWSLMTNLPMYQTCLNDGLKVSRRMANLVVNLPSSANMVFQ